MRALNIVYVLISFAFGMFVGVWYQNSRQTFKSEEVIAKEIVLLEKYKNMPNCKDVRTSKTDWGTILINDGVIVWRYKPDQESLQKVIVDKTMTSAHEKGILSCTSHDQI